jgi:hypothetical protein
VVGEEEDQNLDHPEAEEEKAVEAVEEWNPVPINAERFRTEIFSPDRPGQVCVVSEVKRWGKARAQVDSGAAEKVGPKEIPNAFTMKENVMSRNGSGYVAANGTKIRNYGEKRIDGHTEAGGGMSMRIQRADGKKVLGSVHKMNLGGNVVALDGNKITRRTRRPGRRPGLSMRAFSV